jgi:cytidyltransferase-like protein
MTIISESDLNTIREKNKNKKISCGLGTFDLLHAGHILFLEDCKKHGDIIVIGVAKDSLIKNYKGKKRPILNEHIRLKSVDSIKGVDYTYLIDYPSWSKNGSHKETLGALLEKLKPDCYVVNSDMSDLDERKSLAKDNNVKFIVLNRNCPIEFEDISTSKIISKIKSE